jgi:hypothetical protein
MSDLPRATRSALDSLADALTLTFEDEGYLVDSAAAMHVAFAHGWRGKSGLTTDLAYYSVVSAVRASNVLTFRKVKGTGVEVQTFEGGVDRRFRLRRASRDADGRLTVLASSDSSLASDDEETASLFPPERWVLGYIINDDRRVTEVVVGQRVGYEVGPPGKVIFGREELLGGAGPAPTDFRPEVDDDLFGEEDDTGTWGTGS